MKKLPLIKLIFSMTVFGTIGVVLRFTVAERGFVASLRGIVGGLMLLFALLIMKRKPSLSDIKKNLSLLLVSGAAIGVNWILLFESYSHTTIAVATLCYYMAPIFVIVLTPLVLGGKTSVQKYISVGIAFVGMVLVSGVTQAGGGNLTGVLLSLGAAALYAAVTLINKKLDGVSAYDSTIIQLTVAGLAVLPYTLIAERPDVSTLGAGDCLIILIICLVHTALAYLCYFSAVKDLPAETVAIFSYLDPIVAVLLSLLIGEGMTLITGIGAVLIVGALVTSEIKFKK